LFRSDRTGSLNKISPHLTFIVDMQWFRVKWNCRGFPWLFLRNHFLQGKRAL